MRKNIASSSHNNNSNNQTSRLTKVTHLFVKEDPNIIFTRAGKGNITIALNKDYYIDNVNNMLLNTNTYIFMNMRSSVKSYKKDTSYIEKLRQEYISSSIYRKLYCSTGHCRKPMHFLKFIKRVCSLECHPTQYIPRRYKFEQNLNKLNLARNPLRTLQVTRFLDLSGFTKLDVS